MQGVNGGKVVHNLGDNTSSARIPALVIAVLNQELEEFQYVILMAQKLAKACEFRSDTMEPMHVHLPHHSQEPLVESTYSRVT